jgi:hypothetical protein
MSLKGWLIKNKPSECRDVSASLLPDHDLESTPEKKKMIKAANKAVFKILSPKSGVKRKRGSYGHYDFDCYIDIEFF